MRGSVSPRDGARSARLEIENCERIAATHQVGIGKAAIAQLLACVGALEEAGRPREPGDDAALEAVVELVRPLGCEAREPGRLHDRHADAQHRELGRAGAVVDQEVARERAQLCGRDPGVARTRCSSASRCSGKTVTGWATSTAMATYCSSSRFVLPDRNPPLLCSTTERKFWLRLEVRER